MNGDVINTILIDYYACIYQMLIVVLIGTSLICMQIMNSQNQINLTLNQFCHPQK